MTHPPGGPVLAYSQTAQFRTSTPPTRVVVEALLASHGLRLIPQVRETGAMALLLVDGRTGRPPLRVPEAIARQLRAWLDTGVGSAVA